MDDAARLADELRRAWAGGAWHGPSLREALDGVSAADAAARPVAGAHSVWELVLHLTAWAHEARRRALGATPGEPEEGDWPPAPAGPDAREEAWADARAALGVAHDALCAVAAGLDPAALDRPVAGSGGEAARPLRAVLHGVAQHDAYHGGQIMLLRKALAARG